VSAYHVRPEPQQRWYSCKNLEISGQWRHKDSVTSQTPRRKSRTGLNPGTGVATALTHHLLSCASYPPLVASFDWDTLARLCSEPESRLVERCNHYCLHSTVASATFLICFTDLWITLYIIQEYLSIYPSSFAEIDFNSFSSKLNCLTYLQGSFQGNSYVKHNLFNLKRNDINYTINKRAVYNRHYTYWAIIIPGKHFMLQRPHFTFIAWNDVRILVVHLV